MWQNGARQNINYRMKGTISDFRQYQGDKMVRNHDVHSTGKLTEESGFTRNPIEALPGLGAYATQG
ncbi:MAG: hypothetical protein BWY63_03799 [Chloroflexi bacterium ADurb.Bin360]|nr:MAG: hypothetical protein BWY63_03799 [Chloroflexi bacterium ADurb.Bin360]